MNFTYDGVARDASKTLGNLASTVPFSPEFLEFRDAFFGPAHELISTASENPARHKIWIVPAECSPFSARDSIRGPKQRNMLRPFLTGISIYWGWIDQG
jgi:hypothetical protein